MLFLHRISNAVWFMEESFAQNYLPLVASWIKDAATPIHVKNTQRNNLGIFTVAGDKSEVSFFNVNGKYSALDFIQAAPENSVIILTLTDAITKHDQFCGPYGMQTYSQLLKAAYANDNVKGVALLIESGGGEGGAMRLLVGTINERNKPVLAFIDDFAASAAYGIASACDVVTANSKTARVGSVGVYLTLADYTEYFQKQGINILEIYAPQSKDKNKDYKDAISGDTKSLEEIARVYCDDFIESIEKNRGDKLTGKREEWATGKMFFADEAQRIGLIDNIDTFDNFLNYFNT